MFSDIIVYAGDQSTALKGARILSDTAYFRVRCFGPYSRWKGETETGNGRLWTEITSKSTTGKHRRKNEQK